MITLRGLLGLTLLCSLLGLPFLAQAQPMAIPAVRLDVSPTTDRQQISASLQILALLTILSLAPAILILTTAFTRIIIVLSFLRSALGTPTVPPNQIIIGLSLFLTFFVMSPTYQKVYNEAIVPYTRQKNPISLEEAVSLAEKPVREFMLKNTYESDLSFFLKLRNERPRSKSEVSIVTLIPAFVISELKTGFIVGFYIFVPFVLIDLIVASVLMGMGMMMMPPTVVSLPAKLLIFILADGWILLMNTLLAGYQ